MNATPKHVKTASAVNADGCLTQCQLLQMALADGPKTTAELRDMGVSEFLCKRFGLQLM